MLATVHEECWEDDVDSDWEEFDRLVEKYRLRHRNVPASPLLNNVRRYDHRREQEHVFYPCPPPQPSELMDDLDYADMVMYGRFAKDLGEYAKDEAYRAKALERKRKKEDRQRNKELQKQRGKCASKLIAAFGFLWRNTFARLGEDWVFLALLGIIMAFISFLMDRGISMCNNARIWLYEDSAAHPVLQYLAWVSLPVFLILFATGFCHIVAPQSIGSGIPEMKTILRGVTLKEYLTFRTLVAKVVGLTATLGSGMPLGKEGPFVHIASITAAVLSRLVTSFKGIYENESRQSEMLAAACAVGVAACFSAPIGGVLFSIEVTTVYFAVRNYWRGFFAAVCGATVFRLLGVWFQKQATVKALFATSFKRDFPFDPQELVVFALMGAVSGLGGAAWVWLHRQYVLFMRRNKRMTAFLQKNRFLYPGIVSLVVSSVAFPLGLGQYMAADLSTHQQVTSLFTNFTWTKEELNVEEAEIVRHWSTPHTGVFVSLVGYTAFTFVFSIIASTIPVPSGIFIPVFKIGASLGRIFGEAMHLWFPQGVHYGNMVAPIIPGGYATVGAAAFSGAVTHTVSTTMIVFEMTGQITHIIPMMIAVLIAKAIAAQFQPSVFDNIIIIRNLPYLPDLLPSSSKMYNVYVEDFMVRDVKYIWNGMSYRKLKEILKENRNLKGFPLVDNPGSMILLGSIQRLELIKLIERHIGRERRLQVAARWQKEAQERAKEELERKIWEETQKQRRPSRFEVIPAPDIFQLRQHSTGELISPTNLAGGDVNGGNPLYGTHPKKSILKKTNSFTLRSFSPVMSPTSTPYTTVTGAESRIRLAFDAIFRKSATLQDVDPNPDPEVGVGGSMNVNMAMGDIPDSPPVPPSPRMYKKVQLPRERVIDMSPEDQKQWEEEEMTKGVNFDKCHIDPAPFQLVEKTSLLKVHSLFSMIGVNHAYVTTIGRLIGVVALKELRKAIEDSNAGNIPSHQPPHITLTPPPGSETKNDLSLTSDPRSNDTITSMDSALSCNTAASETDIEDSVNKSRL